MAGHHGLSRTNVTGDALLAAPGELELVRAFVNTRDLELGLEALAARTAKLPRVELRAPDRAIGRDTISAIQSGTILGYQALADGLIDRIRHELADAAGVPAADVRVILTGGLSGAPWARGIAGVDAIDPDLTLKGLAILHAEVGGGQPLELGLPR